VIKEQIQEVRTTTKELVAEQIRDKKVLKQDHRKVNNAWALQGIVVMRAASITCLHKKYHFLKEDGDQSHEYKE